MSQDFLVEIGTEELPPKALLSLSNAFNDQITSQLKAFGIAYGAVNAFASPRRLAVQIYDLEEQGQSSEIEAWGPPAKICFDDQGSPTKPALAFINKNAHLGANIEDIKSYIHNDGKADKLFIKATQAGPLTRERLADIVNHALDQLPIPKRMRWGASDTQFVRPVQWVVMLYGKKVLTNSTILDLTPSNISRGHRFHSPDELPIGHPSEYADLLRSHFVEPSFEQRKQLISDGVKALGEELGGQAIVDADLLEEVAALNEWPVPLAGSFDDSFLAVPSEALISSMKSHQKYFHVVDSDGNLLPNFITVANIQSKEPQKVIEGNEKVIRPRLSDAAFFFETDKRLTQLERRERLKPIVFQDKLGSIFDKTERITSLASAIAEKLSANPEQTIRAAQLCKSDLVSEMVLEFGDLQGIMGQYYATNDDEDTAVSAAMFEHYLPRFSGDKLPTEPVSICIALADRIDTLTGIFGIGELPTGSKDPFALRRASLGVLRIIIENKLNLNLTSLLDLSINTHVNNGIDESASKLVLTYINDRFNALYTDLKPEVIQSVLVKSLDNPLDIHARILAVNDFYQLPAADSLAAANKRVQNILAKNSHIDNGEVDSDLLSEPAEINLFDALNRCETSIYADNQAKEYSQALTQLAVLQQPVDAFFDNVMVMCEDEALRNNRLSLLHRLHQLFTGIADISQLAGIQND